MPADGVRAVHLTVGGPVDPWLRLGLPIVGDTGSAMLITDNCSIIWPDGDLPSGSLMLGLSEVPAGSTIDGVAVDTSVAPEPDMSSPLSIDHLVINTDSLDRTCAAVERVTGHPLKRIREVGAMRQGFHRLGPGGLIIEVVERPGVDHVSLWGFVVTVADLDGVVANANGAIGAPRDAVQPGRRIATVASSADLGVAVAFMSR
jgi:hypothetical protein